MPRRLCMLRLLCALLPFAGLANPMPAHSQTVTTIVPDFGGNDGLSVDADGYIYVNARGMTFNGKRVIRVAPNGTFQPYAVGLNPFPVGSVFDALGNLYVTGFNWGNIRRIAPDGSHSVIATGIPGAGGLERDSAGNFYCAAFNANYVARIAPDSAVTVFAQGGFVNGPSGLAYHAATGCLYISNWFDGIVARYELDGTATAFATVPEFPVGPLTIVGNHIYTTAPNGNRVYRIELATGNVSAFAGTGVPGDADGDASVAQFRNPTGIGANADGSLLYISDTAPSGRGRLRRIFLTDPTSATALPPPEAQQLFLSPNPFTQRAQIRYSLDRAARVDLAVYDLAGRLVYAVASRAQSQGEHQVSWDGRDRMGRPVSAGVYHVRLSLDGLPQTRRLIRLR